MGVKGFDNREILDHVYNKRQTKRSELFCSILVYSIFLLRKHKCEYTPYSQMADAREKTGTRHQNEAF